MKSIPRPFVSFISVIAVSLLTGCQSIPLAPDAAVIESPAMEKQLLGTRPISLQWISWEDYGTAEVTRDSGGVIRLRGEQRSTESGNTDYLTIGGRVTRITERTFEFDGTIEIRVSHILGGQPYRRTGPQQFFLYGDRGFWRLHDMENEEGSTDYVDIYFDLPTARASNAEWVD